MQLSPEQQKAIEEQKAQCIFCQIISGKVPSKKVYEDKLILGILDINPASKGHVLLMPKEHYPIMPIIPPETFKHMFSKLKHIDGAVKDALLCKQTTVMIANGGAAGQQSSHFMLHIIPRDGGDGLDMLDVKGKESSEEDIKSVAEKVAVLDPMLKKNLPALGYGEPQAAGAPGGAGPGGAGMGMPEKMTKEQVLRLIDANPPVKEIILSQPDKFKQLVPNHPQLSQIFKDVDLDEIIADVKKRSKPKEPGKLDLEDALK